MPPRPAAKSSGGGDDEAGPRLSPAEMEAIEQQQAQEEGDAAAGANVDKAIDISWHAKVFVETIIVVNAAQMGACVDPDDLPQLREVCSISEHVFISIFCIEVIFKIYNQGWAYFRVRWNQFDFVITGMAILDNWILNPLLQVKQSPFSNIMILRLVRLLRILRILKVLRTHRELQMLMEGLVGALRAMVWVAMLLGFLIYVTAIICVSLFSKVDSDYDLTFHSIPQAIFSLFTVAILADWTDIVMPIISVHPWSAFLFVMFTIVATFGILNLIIGVITERTTLVQRSYEAHTQYSKDIGRMRSIEKIASLVFGTQENGTINQQELSEKMTHEVHGPMIMTLIGSVQLPVGFTILDLHPMFDRDASGSINRDEFIHGMKRLIFSNAFQRSCIMQSAIADVLVEIKRVEGRTILLIDKEVAGLRREVTRATRQRVATNFSRFGGEGDGDAAEMPEGEAAEGGHTKPTAEKPVEERPVEAATAVFQLPSGGLSVHEVMCHQKELKVLSSTLLLRLTEPVVQLLTEGLQAEVWADLSPSALASDLARTSKHAHRVSDLTALSAGSLTALSAGADGQQRTTSRGSIPTKLQEGERRPASQQAESRLQALGPLPPRCTRKRDQHAGGSEYSSRGSARNFGAPGTASAPSLENPEPNPEPHREESDDFVTAVRLGLGSSSLNTRPMVAKLRAV